VASKPETVTFITDQLAAGGVEATAKKMFGEYGLYVGGKMVAMVCDDQLFVKPTEAGRAFAGGVDEAPPYPGAKPCLLVDGDRLEDGDWLAELFTATEHALPAPKPKKKR
jgi:TfoX/Sxy family transcriptional regulator of competence genes